jgi:hypothetical protein
MTGSANVIITAAPVLLVDQFDNSSVKEPAKFDSQNIALTGTVSDNYDIISFEINGEPVELVDNKWSYSLELMEFETKQLLFRIVSASGAETYISHFVAYNYQKFNPSISFEPVPTVEYVHTSKNNVLLSGSLFDLDGSISDVKVNGVSIDTFNEEFWYYDYEVVQDTVTLVVVDVYDNLGHKSSKEIYVCHRIPNIKLDIDSNNVTGHSMQIDFSTTNPKECDFISKVVVKGIDNIENIQLFGSMSTTQIDGGYIVYMASDNGDKVDIQNLSMLVSYDYKVDGFSIEIETVHGGKIIYDIELIWERTYWLTGIDCTTHNMVDDSIVKEMIRGNKN